MYHVYKKGYNTLPNLRKLKNEEVFETNKTDSNLIQKEKKEALKNQLFFVEKNHDPILYKVSEDWILKNYPFKLKSEKYLDIVKETDEDFLIHRIKDGKDFLSSAHVCFASHWDPLDKIGKTFDEIHAPVPMNLKNSKKLVHAMIYGGIFERFVWSVVYENKYNFHPRLKHKKFNKENPNVLIKVERQVTVGFPDYDFCLFILRQYLIQENQIDKSSLIKSIEEMNPEQKMYKGLENCDDLIFYLKNTK